MSSYIGRGLEQIDNISKLDNLSFNGGTTYALTKDSVGFTPISSNALLISISGVIQQGNFSVDGTNIVFNSAVASSESCDFIMHYGQGVAFTPADNSITKDKTNFISNSSSSGVVSKGDGGSVDGSISLNCSQNSHFTKISSSPHSAYSGNLNFVLPSSHGTNGQFMKTDGSGNLSFAEAGGLHTQVGHTSISASQNINIDGVFSSTYKNYSIFIEGWSHQNSTSQLYWTYRTGTSGSYASGGGTQGGAAAGRLRHPSSYPTEMGNDAQNNQSVRLTTDVYNNEYSSLHLYCFNPYSTSRRSTISGRAVYREGSTGRVGFTDFGFISIGSEQHTGFNLYTQGSFNSGGTVTVYGITDGS